MKYGIKLNNRRLVCHIRNADRNQIISPKPILMRTNVHQNLEDEKAENHHFRIGPLPQYARVLNEVVPLTESSAVLELLLQYMYRQPQPDLKNVDFETLAGVAEAAEKYQVFTAISWCKMLME